MGRTTTIVKRATRDANKYEPEPQDDLTFPFETYVAAVYQGEADEAMLKHALEEALADVPIVAGVIVRTQQNTMQVEVDHDGAGVPFTVQSSDDLADRGLAQIIDQGDVDDDGCSSRVCRWVLENARERAHAVSELSDEGRIGIEAHVCEPVTRVRVTKARRCYVVSVQVSHLVGDAWSVFLLWDAWSRAYASLSASSNEVATVAANSVWWDSARFCENLPKSRPGCTPELMSFDKAWPVWLRERAELVKAQAEHGGDNGCTLWLRLSEDGMRLLRESSGGKSFDVLMSMLSPENVRWFRIAYDSRISHPDADSSHWFGKGAYRLYGRAGVNIDSIEASDVRRALRPDGSASDVPTRDDVVHGSYLAASYWSREPATFPAGNAMPAFGSSTGRPFFPAFFLPHLQYMHVPPVLDSDGVFAYTRRVSGQYMVAAYGSAHQLGHIAMEVRRRTSECGLVEGACGAFEVHVGTACWCRPPPRLLVARAAEAA